VLLADFIRSGTRRLKDLYPSPEARGLVLMLCEELLGVKSYTHILVPGTVVPSEREAALQEGLQRLCEGEPIQYILGYTDFCGQRFTVGPGVLIPRPETEELVGEAVRMLRSRDTQQPQRVLDLCTGSGCIAWSVMRAVPRVEVVGLDLSEKALDYARVQSRPGLDADSPKFLQADVLDTEQAFPYGPFDLVVSNPPYVMERERAAMRTNVLAHEPAEALFVPDTDPLRFYRAIARWAQRFLRPDGAGIVEINEAFGAETAAVFCESGFKNVQILPDFARKERFIRFSVPTMPAKS